ncbi:glycosyltransferase [Paraburkholderia sp. EG285A]|uniref:glycosyltransferase n=1 Tax=Paraburkholderia sp. EG285A TaxID=3237009 RepID=UPI0034D19A24
MSVFILHPGKANYPEIAAYSDCLTQRGVPVEHGDLGALNRVAENRRAVLWCIMGLYRALPPARFVVHDYRSLSVGRMAFVKDWIKRALNLRPNLRIFQNERMRDAMAFSDGVPSLLLPMGVPDWIFDVTDDGARSIPAGKFCYIGEMSRERGFHKVLGAFRNAHRDPSEALVLVGRPEQSILDEFRDVPGIVFTGRVPQQDALRIVRRSDHAICYFPYHRPHCFQTPTKLLEYAALGKSIICNDAPSNVLAARELDIRCHVTGPRIFDELFSGAPIELQRNDPRKIVSLEWGRVIERSGVLERIGAATGRTSLMTHQRERVNEGGQTR